MSRLRAFGLSEYAARAYLALLDLGITEARDVSTLSKVPQAKIYHVLEQLQEKGLVLVLPEFPKKYAPVPFDDFLQRVFEEHTKAAATIEAEREELAELFRVMGDAEVGDRGFFTIVRGRRNVLGKLDELAAGAQRSLILLATAGTLERREALLPALRDARGRGVDVRVLAPLDAATLDAAGAFEPFATVRAREMAGAAPSAKVAMAVADGERAFLIHFVPDDASLHVGKDVGMLTDQEAMVAAILALLEPHWERAAPIAVRRDEVREGRRPAFTRVYATGEDAWAAFGASLARGGRELLYHDAHGAQLPREDAPLLQRTLHERGGGFRAILNLADVAFLDAYEAFAAGVPGCEVRHAAPRGAGRYWLLDGQEGFFSVAPRERGVGAEMVVHTNDPAVVASMRASFEAAWKTATPLALRRREVELFPRLQPGDVGVGMLFNLLGDAVVVADAENRVVLWNPAATEVFGYRVHEILGQPLECLLPEDGRAKSLAWLASQRSAAARLDPDTLVEGQAVRKDGGVLDVEIMARQLDAASPGGPFLLAVVRDVTARKAAARAQRDAQERIIRTYESMQEAFFALDRDWRIVYMNPVAERMRRGPADAVLGQVLWDAFPDLKGSKFDTEYHRAMRDGVAVHVEEHYPRMDRWFEAKAYPTPEGLSVYYHDITARKKAEADLRERESVLSDAERLANFGTWRWDVRADRVAWTAHLARIFALDAEGAPRTLAALLARIHPEDRASFEAELRRALRVRDTFEASARVVHPDGSVRFVESRGGVMVDAAGEPVCVVGVTRDLTGVREVLGAARGSEARFERAFADAPIGMAILGRGARFLQANRAFARMLGWTEDELRAMTLESLTHPDDVEATRALARRLEEGAPTSPLEVRYVRRDGHVVRGRLTMSLVRAPSGEPELIAQVEEIATTIPVLDAEPPTRSASRETSR